MVLSSSSKDVLEGVDEIIIIDNGAYNVRIVSVPYPFTSSSRSPSADDIGIYPNFIARTRSATSRKSYISSQILTDLDEYGGLVLRQPHQKGMISDWAAQKLIWDHVFASHFASLRPSNKRWLENKAVIITESYLGLDEVRNATDLMLFEQYGARAVWRCDAASLAVWTDHFDSEHRQQPKLSAHAQDRDVQPPTKRIRQSRESVDSRMPQVSFSHSGSTAAKGTSMFRRPETLLVLDLSYSACHAVPVVCGSVQYANIKRLDVGGKILTNLLKETLSFRQLDMMDEFWLVDYVRRHTSFVAASSMNAPHTRRLNPEQILSELRKRAQSLVTAPCDWSFDQLLTLCKYGYKKRRDGFEASMPNVTIQWKLPDYSTSAANANMLAKESKDEARKYGTIVSGPNPGSQPNLAMSLAESSSDEERNFEASFIAQAPSASSLGTFQGNTKVSAAANPDTGEEAEDEDDPQFLTLSNERFAVSEVLFAPSMIGLTQNGVCELAAEAIASFVQSGSGSASVSGDLLWANILLIGGLANIPGLKRRLQLELRSLAPSGVPDIRIQIAKPPPQSQHTDLTPITAGIILATAPASSLEHDWLHSKFLSSNEWVQASNPTALARQRFGRP